MEIVQHATEDDLERYAMRTLPAPEVESLEEHLLICAECRDRLTATDQFVAAMKAAAAVRGNGQGEIGTLWAVAFSRRGCRHTTGRNGRVPYKAICVGGTNIVRIPIQSRRPSHRSLSSVSSISSADPRIRSLVLESQ